MTVTTHPLVLAALVLAAAGTARAQVCGETHAGRIAIVLGGYAVTQATVIALRHDDWWTTPARSFHFANRASPSQGQDRLLHTAIGYHVSQLGALVWNWTCVSPTAAGWLGAALGIAVSLPKEIGDGLHENKGFSAPDMLFAAGGSVLPALHRAWAPSRALQVKLNYWPSAELRNRTGNFPQLENDYAGQRYYVVLVPGRLASGAGLWPDWLGIAVGHGVPRWISGPPVHDWYVTLDLDLQGLPIPAGWWRGVARVLDQIHFPAPGIRVREGEVVMGLF